MEKLGRTSQKSQNLIRRSSQQGGKGQNRFCVSCRSIGNSDNALLLLHGYFEIFKKGEVFPSGFGVGRIICPEVPFHVVDEHSIFEFWIDFCYLLKLSLNDGGIFLLERFFG